MKSDDIYNETPEPANGGTQEWGPHELRVLCASTRLRENLKRLLRPLIRTVEMISVAFGAVTLLGAFAFQFLPGLAGSDHQRAGALLTLATFSACTFIATKLGTNDFGTGRSINWLALGAIAAAVYFWFGFPRKDDCLHFSLPALGSVVLLMLALLLYSGRGGRPWVVGGSLMLLVTLAVQDWRPGHSVRERKRCEVAPSPLWQTQLNWLTYGFRGRSSDWLSATRSFAGRS
jgi:hypothetical protein